MKIVLGVTGTKNLAMLNAVRHLVNEFNLCHINIKQPVIDEIALELGISAHEVAHTLNPYQRIEKYDCLALDLEQKLTKQKMEFNKLFFVEYAQRNILKNSRLNGIFSGCIISNITTEDEADFIRSSGANLLHLIDNRELGATERIRIDSLDSVFVTSSNYEAKMGALSEMLERFLPLKQKAS